MWRAKIPVKTFPIRKRVYTEMYMDGKKGLYIQKVRRDQIKKWRTTEKRVTKNGRKVKLWEWKYGSLFRMTYIIRKESLTNGSLFERTLWKISQCETRFFERVLWYTSIFSVVNPLKEEMVNLLKMSRTEVAFALVSVLRDERPQLCWSYCSELRILCWSITSRNPAHKVGFFYDGMEYFPI